MHFFPARTKLVELEEVVLSDNTDAPKVVESKF